MAGIHPEKRLRDFHRRHDELLNEPFQVVEQTLFVSEKVFEVDSLKIDAALQTTHEQLGSTCQFFEARAQGNQISVDLAFVGRFQRCKYGKLGQQAADVREGGR